MLRRHQDEADSRIFRRMVETNPNGVLLTEPPFQEPGPRITYANPAFERMTGYSLAEIQGRSPRFLDGPDTDPQSRRRIAEEIAAGRGLTEEMLHYRKDGTPFWTSIRIAPVTDSSGSVTHYFSVQADITLARQAKLERQALTRDLKALISAIPGVLMRHRPRDDGKWTRSFIAPGVEALTGFTVEEAYAFGWWVQNINEADKQALDFKLRQAVEGGETQADFRFLRKDGAWIWIRILLRGHVGPDGAREVIGIWSDVSEEYRLRLEGERLTADLQHVIATMPGVLIRVQKDADGRYVRRFISPAIEALTGYTVEEAREAVLVQIAAAPAPAPVSFSMPPPPGLAPWPTTTSIASAMRRWSGSMP
jgi:PAS domain S-box-containing protein